MTSKPPQAEEKPSRKGKEKKERAWDEEELLPVFEVAKVKQIALPTNVRSLEHWGTAVVQRGKHKDWRYAEVWEQDRSYFNWLHGRHEELSPPMRDLSAYGMLRQQQQRKR